MQVFYDLMRLVRDNKDRAAAAAAGGRKVNSATNGREPRRKKRCTILWRTLPRGPGPQSGPTSSFWHTFRAWLGQASHFVATRQQCLLQWCSRLGSVTGMQCYPWATSPWILHPQFLWLGKAPQYLCIFLLVNLKYCLYISGLWKPCAGCLNPGYVMFEMLCGYSLCGCGRRFEACFTKNHNGGTEDLLSWGKSCSPISWKVAQFY